MAKTSGLVTAFSWGGTVGIHSVIIGEVGCVASYRWTEGVSDAEVVSIACKCLGVENVNQTLLPYGRPVTRLKPHYGRSTPHRRE